MTGSLLRSIAYLTDNRPVLRILLEELYHPFTIGSDLHEPFGMVFGSKGRTILIGLFADYCVVCIVNQ